MQRRSESGATVTATADGGAHEARSGLSTSMPGATSSPRSGQATRSNDEPRAPGSSTSTDPQPEPPHGQQTRRGGACFNAPRRPPRSRELPPSATGLDPPRNSRHEHGAPSGREIGCPCRCEACSRRRRRCGGRRPSRRGDHEAGLQQRHRVDPEGMGDLLPGHTVGAASGHLHDVVTELLRKGLGHGHILPGLPTQAISDVTPTRSRPMPRSRRGPSETLRSELWQAESGQTGVPIFNETRWTA
jgi:hypothetical protein